MSAARESAVAAAAREAFAADRNSVAAAFHVGGWEGSNTISLADGRNATVFHSESVLEIRERMVDAGTEERLVILTTLPEYQLGDDVLYRLASRRVRRIGEWEPVLNMFAARTMDPRLTKIKNLPDILQRHSTSGGYEKAPNGALTQTHVWNQLINALFGGAPSTLSGLVSALVDPDVSDKLKELPPEVVDTVVGILIERLGPGAEPALTLVMHDESGDLIPLALLARVVYSGEEGETNLAAARGWMQAKWSSKPSDAAGLALASAAEENYFTADPDQQNSWQDKVVQLLTQAGLESEAWRSDVITSGFDQRIERIGSVLSEPSNDDRLGFARSELRRTREHDMASSPKGRLRVRNLEMAIRCWLFLGTKDESPDSFEQAAIQQRDEGGWLDLAVQTLREADEVLSPLNQRYSELVEAVDARRTARARKFGELLAQATEVDSLGSSIGVEDAIAERVIRIATKRRTFFLVLDGLSEAALRSLLPDLEQEGWVEIGPEGERRPPMVAMLPSVTEASRASLLSGKRQLGGQVVERDGLAAALSNFGETSLFHKADLANDANKVLQEIAGGKRVVGVVVNAIDDLLSDGDQVRIEWSLDSIAYVRALLSAAAEAERTVVLAGDHGHVLEHGSELRSNDSGGSRWRDSSVPAGKDEVSVVGQRVLKGEGEVILPTTEYVRYRTKAAGYHGGATPQEVITPLVVFAQKGSEIEGWDACAGAEPSWWLLDSEAEQEEAKSPRLVRRKSSIRVEGQGVFFEEPDSDAIIGGQTYPGWIDQLMASPEFEAAEERAPRTPDRSHLIGLLTALDRDQYRTSESAAAIEIGVSVHRMTSVVASLRPLLNLEGFSILSQDRTTGEIRLDRELLDKQFSL